MQKHPKELADNPRSNSKFKYYKAPIRYRTVRVRNGPN